MQGPEASKSPTPLSMSKSMPSIPKSAHFATCSAILSAASTDSNHGQEYLVSEYRAPPMAAKTGVSGLAMATLPIAGGNAGINSGFTNANQRTFAASMYCGNSG